MHPGVKDVEEKLVSIKLRRGYFPKWPKWPKIPGTDLIKKAHAGETIQLPVSEAQECLDREIAIPEKYTL